MLAAVVAESGRAQSFDREVAFLLIPSGARPVGMGRAAVAAPGSLQGVSWNPAAVAAIRDIAPLVSSYEGPLEFDVTQLALAVPAGGIGVFAISAEVQSFGEIALTGAGSADNTTGVVTPGNVIVGITYGRSLPGRLAFGLTGKWIRSDLVAGLRGSTVALDAGVLWAPFESVPLDLGLSAVNLGRGLKLEDHPGAARDPLPGRVRFGLAYDLLGHAWPELGWQLLVALDEERAVRRLGTASRYVGVELGFEGVLFLRGGLVSESLVETNRGATVGMGMRLGFLEFDIARELGVNELGDETHVSIGAHF
jgi:hypothetical protein